VPKQVLVYRVTVEDADADSARQYLNKLRDTFRMISEELVSWGYTGDETYSQSEVYVEQDND
jgi:hypothetical protein